MAGHPQKYTLRELDPGEFDHWEQFLSSQEATYFHTIKWAELIERVFNRSYKVLAIYEKEKIVSGVLFWPKRRWTFSIVTSVPLTPYQGPVIEALEKQPSSSRIAYYQQINTLFADFFSQRYDFLQIPLNHPYDDVRPYLWSGFEVDIKYNYRFKITDKLEQQFSSSVRRHIKKSEQARLQVELSTDPADLINMVVHSYQHHGIQPPASVIQLTNLSNMLTEQKQAELYYLLNDSQENVAGILLLHDKYHVYYLLSGIDPKYRALNPMYFLLDNLFRQKQYQGKTFDFMGANTQSIEQFKRSFGGALFSYPQLSFYRSSFSRKLAGLRIKQLQKRRTRR